MAGFVVGCLPDPSDLFHRIDRRLFPNRGCWSGAVHDAPPLFIFPPGHGKNMRASSPPTVISIAHNPPQGVTWGYWNTGSGIFSQDRRAIPNIAGAGNLSRLAMKCAKICME